MGAMEIIVVAALLVLFAGAVILNEYLKRQRGESLKETVWKSYVIDLRTTESTKDSITSR